MVACVAHQNSFFRGAGLIFHHQALTQCKVVKGRKGGKEEEEKDRTTVTKGERRGEKEPTGVRERERKYRAVK